MNALYLDLSSYIIMSNNNYCLIKQLDSWWYYKGPGDGVKNWTAMPTVFPNGIDTVVKETGWRIFAHNRWW